MNTKLSKWFGVVFWAIWLALPSVALSDASYENEVRAECQTYAQMDAVPADQIQEYIDNCMQSYGVTVTVPDADVNETRDLTSDEFSQDPPSDEASNE